MITSSILVKKSKNGYYISWFVCEPELEAAWNEVSEIKYNQPNEADIWFPKHWNVILPAGV